MISHKCCPISFIDPCDKAQCAYYSKCKVLPDRSTSCECPVCPSADKDYKPVCGNDGRSYYSKCHLQSDACLLQRNIVVSKEGPCGEFLVIQVFFDDPNRFYQHLFNLIGRDIAEQIDVETKNFIDDVHLYLALYFKLNSSSSGHTSTHFSIKRYRDLKAI